MAASVPVRFLPDDIMTNPIYDALYAADPLAFVPRDVDTLVRLVRLTMPPARLADVRVLV